MSGLWKWRAGHLRLTRGAKAPPRRRVPTLTLTSANRYLRVALRRRFRGAFYAGGYRARCLRASRTAYQCSPSWFQGDASFYGPARIWLSSRSGDTWWNYSWRITRIDTYCSQVQHRHHCTKLYVVK